MYIHVPHAICVGIGIHTYSRLQIGWQKILRLFLETFNLVPGVPGFSWDLSWVPCYYLVLIVNPMGRIVVRWIFVEMISRFFATLSAIGCTYACIHILIDMACGTCIYIVSKITYMHGTYICSYAYIHIHTCTHTYTYAVWYMYTHSILGYLYARNMYICIYIGSYAHTHI